ncbi:hypothetical protein PBI_SCTP2_478 [Salicola phage SCTP-2]|nr:hypothetical protein PBI_SCTP2_478 [Salicola phage SCTP-2]
MHIPIMILKSKDTTIELYILNPGSIFKEFCGSKSGLTV